MSDHHSSDLTQPKINDVSNMFSYFNPAPFGNYCVPCQCLVGSDKNAIIFHMKDKHKIALHHNQSIVIEKFITEKMSEASLLLSFHVHEACAYDGYVCEHGASFTSKICT